MPVRLVTRKMHAFLDYPVAVSLMAMPFVLGLGNSSPAAMWLSVGVGLAALVLTLLTDHETGLVRVLPYSFHLAVDLAVGIAFAVAPFALGFRGIDAWYYWINAAAVLTVVSLHKPVEATSPMAAAA